MFICYHCGKEIVEDKEIREYEFHQDGVYCSLECLYKEMKDVEDWDVTEKVV